MLIFVYNIGGQEAKSEEFSSPSRRSQLKKRNSSSTTGDSKVPAGVAS